MIKRGNRIVCVPALVGLVGLGSGGAMGCGDDDPVLVFNAYNRNAMNPDISTPDQGLPDMGSDMSNPCLLYTSPSPRDVEESRMPSSA